MNNLAKINDVADFFQLLIDAIGVIIPVLILVGIAAYFLIGVRFMASTGNEKTREDYKKMLLYGIVAIFVLITFVGILNWLIDIFNFSNNNPINFSDLPK